MSPRTALRSPLLLLIAAFAFPACDSVSTADSSVEPYDGAVSPSAAVADGGPLRVRFGGFSDGTRYRESHAKDAFGSGISWASSNDWTSRGNLLEVFNSQLRFRIPPGVHGDGTGGKIRVPLQSRTGYYLQYDVRFDSGFDFTPPSGGSNGGKLPGLAGGDGNTGGDPGWDGRGFSARLMWRGDRATGSDRARLYAYVYHKDQPEEYGEYLDAGYSVSTNKWYTVRIYVGMNTSSNKNGTLRVWIKEKGGFGDSRLSRTNMRWMTTNIGVDEALIHVFNGGGTSKWDLTTTSFVRLDNIFTCYKADECDAL